VTTGTTTTRGAAQDKAAADTALRELLTPEGREDPYTRYATLRECSPVHASRLGLFVLTRYDDCAAMLRSPAYRVHDDAWLDAMIPNWRERPALATGGQSLIFRNPPDHTRLRSLVNGPFTPRRVQSLKAQVERFVTAQLDAMADAGGDGGAVDLRDMLALPLPVAMIGLLLGVPESDWEWVRGPATDLTPLVDFFPSSEDLDRADKAAGFFVPYFRELARERARRPADDLISALVAARDEDGQRLTEDELTETAILLFIAGFETSVNLITNGVLAMLEHPDQAALLRADPGLAEQMVEEALRYDAPVQGAGRVAKVDTEIAGVPVPAGKEVWALLGAANRDPAQFPDPDRFDITRTGSKVATFGGGIHFCLGAPLARLEGVVAFPKLVDRFPGLALAGEPVRRRNFNLRGFTEFPVSVQ
jgi:cytochrome P450